MRMRVVGFIALVVVVVAGCTSAPPASVTSVTIDGGAVALQVGENTTMTATVVVTGGASEAVTWSVSPDNIATVDGASGLVTAIAAGAAELTASSTVDSSKSDSVDLTVDAVPSALTSTAVAQPSTLSPNGTNTSTITIQLKDADGNDLTTGGHDVTIGDPSDVFQCPADEGCIGTISAVVDHNDGTYSATYTAGTTDGVVRVRPELNREPLTSGAEITLAFFLLAENGITVLCPDAELDATGTVNGRAYTKRNRQQIVDNELTPDYASTACTSGVTDMSSLFAQASDVPDIGTWDTSNVTSMSYMFHQARGVPSNLGAWDTSNVTTMMAMFDQASFNGDIGSWNTGKVTSMDNMFFATGFDQDIGAWDTRSLASMYGMFSYNQFFNRDIGGWDTSKVTVMGNLFHQATSFDQDLSQWCVEAVTQWAGFDVGATSWSDANKPVWGVPCAR